MNVLLRGDHVLRGGLPPALPATRTRTPLSAEINKHLGRAKILMAMTTNQATSGQTSGIPGVVPSNGHAWMNLMPLWDLSS